MTQKTLGDAVGVSQAAIQKIETGRAAQTTKLLDIANALRLDLSGFPQELAP
jgi:DNA-binding XRE family transcriptional regulator